MLSTLHCKLEKNEATGKKRTAENVTFTQSNNVFDGAYSTFLVTQSKSSKV